MIKEKRINIRRIIIIILLIGIIGYLVSGFLLFLFQKSRVYFPPIQDFNNCSVFSDAQKLNVDGTRFYFKHNSDRLIVFYHGNGDSACNWLKLKDVFQKENLSYIFVEYAGYSNDNQKTSKKLILKDVEHINNFIKTLNYSQLILSGFSLGSGVASYHSTLVKPDKLLLISTYTSIKDVAHQIFYMYPLSILLTENFDNTLYLKNYTGNLMIIHGGKDYGIPIEMAKKLFVSINSKNKQFIEVKEGGHGNIFEFNETIQSIQEFVKK